MPLHLVNTFFLLAVLAFAAWWATGFPHVRFRGQGWLGVAWWVGALAVVVLSMTGAVTALGDTLFPSESLVEGLQADFSPTAHFLVRFRVWHPIIAVATGLYVVLLSRLLASRRPGPRTQRLAYAAVTLVIVQIIAGALNVALLAPVWMQLVHLALAVAVWVALILLGASAFALRPATKAAGPPLAVQDSTVRP